MSGEGRLPIIEGRLPIIEELYKTIDAFVGEGGHPAVILDALHSAMQDTAEHLRSNWQDGRSAEIWEQLANRVEKVHDEVEERLSALGYIWRSGHTG